MKKDILRIKSKIFVYNGVAAWRFLVISKGESAEIRAKYAKRARGWGSIPVEARINNTSWTTSIFPDTKSGCYLLPLKKEIRKKEGILDFDVVDFELKITGGAFLL